MDPQNLGYIVAAFALAAVVLAAMVAAILLDERRLRQALTELGDGRGGS